MPDKEKVKIGETNKEIYFKCKSCGENKLLSELVVMRQFFPPISVCQACSKGSSKSK